MLTQKRSSVAAPPPTAPKVWDGQERAQSQINFGCVRAVRTSSPSGSPVFHWGQPHGERTAMSSTSRTISRAGEGSSPRVFTAC